MYLRLPADALIADRQSAGPATVRAAPCRSLTDTRTDGTPSYRVTPDSVTSARAPPDRVTFG